MSAVNGAAGIKVSTSGTESANLKPDSKVSERTVNRAEGAEQRAESKQAAAEQRVPASTESNASARRSPPRSHYVSNEINHALTQQAVKSASDQEGKNNQEARRAEPRQSSSSEESTEEGATAEKSQSSQSASSSESANGRDGAPRQETVKL